MKKRNIVISSIMIMVMTLMTACSASKEQEAVEKATTIEDVIESAGEAYEEASKNREEDAFDCFGFNGLKENGFSNLGDIVKTARDRGYNDYLKEVYERESTFTYWTTGDTEYTLSVSVEPNNYIYVDEGFHANDGFFISVPQATGAQKVLSNDIICAVHPVINGTNQYGYFCGTTEIFGVPAQVWKVEASDQYNSFEIYCMTDEKYGYGIKLAFKYGGEGLGVTSFITDEQMYDVLNKVTVNGEKANIAEDGLECIHHPSSELEFFWSDEMRDAE